MKRNCLCVTEGRREDINNFELVLKFLVSIGVCLMAEDV